LDNLFRAVVSLGYDPLYVFLGAVAIDNVVGILQAVRTKTFDLHKLPSFLASQFGTKAFLVVAAAAYAAYAAGSSVHDAALAVVAAGGFALTLAVVKDIFQKITVLVTGK
jgi:hypothetical protein